MVWNINAKFLCALLQLVNKLNKNKFQSGIEAITATDKGYLGSFINIS